MKMELVKYRGFGSEYIIYDPNRLNVELTTDLIKKICYINCGTYVDGILYGPIMIDEKIEFIIYKTDGSESRLNMNSIRIFVKYLINAGYSNGNEITVTNNNRDIVVNVLDDIMECYKLSINKPNIKQGEIVPMENSNDFNMDTIYMSGSVKQVGSIILYT
jgi:diaminopimelate epimerase